MDSQWLKAQFSLNPARTKAELAKKLSLEPPAVSKILNGTRQIKAQEYLIMRQFFGLPVDGETSLRKQHDNAYTIQPLDEVFSDHSSNDGEWIIPAEVLGGRTQAPSDKIKILQVRENVMEPDFKQGEYVLVDLSDRKPSPPGVFIVSDGFGHMIRDCAYVPKTTPPEIRISAKNNGFHTQTLKASDFEIVGRVIAKLQMI
jgi:hypothetical protein